MVRGEATQTKVHYKGTHDDFLVFLDSAADYQKWLGDKSVPLAQVVSSFKVFVTHRYALHFSPFFIGAGDADVSRRVKARCPGSLRRRLQGDPRERVWHVGG